MDAYENMKYYYEASQKVLMYVFGNGDIIAILDMVGISFGKTTFWPFQQLLFWCFYYLFTIMFS